MPRQVFTYDPPDRFVAGALGEPGERTFFLQAAASGRVTSVSLEKFQVAALAERVDELLDEVLRQSGGKARVPAVAPAELKDESPLEQPILEEFRVGTMALAWDEDQGRVVIEAQATGDEEEEEEETEAEPLSDALEGPDALRVHMAPGVARAFAQRALEVVSAGRPPCPLCGLPLDPEGHICPRQNGHAGSTLAS